MKRTQKLLALLLSLALLCSAAVIPAAASEQDTRINENVAIFTPTAVYTEITSSEQTSDVRAAISASGTEMSAMYINNIGVDGTWDYYLVDDGSDPYFMCVPDAAAVEAGITTKHAYFNFHFGKTVQKDSASNDYRYLITEFDMATEGGAVAIKPIMRSVYKVTDDKGNTIDTSTFGEAWDATTQSKAPEYFAMTPGEFYHYTIICDVASNVMYIYQNNVLIHAITNGVFSTAVASAWNDGTSITVDCLRIQSSGLAAEENTSLCVNHVNQYSLLASGAGNLADVIGADSLESWTAKKYSVTDTLATLPPLMEVNGTSYNNIVHASAALDNAKDSNTASALRSLWSGYVTVNSNAEINIHTAHFPLLAGANATLEKVDSSIYQSTLTSYKHYTTADSANTTNILKDTKADNTDNIITNISFTNSTSTGMLALSFTQKDGNRYTTWYPAVDEDSFSGIGVATQTSAYVDVNTGTMTKVSSYDQIVYDVDIYTDGEFPQYETYLNIRNSADSGLGNSRIYFSKVAAAADSLGMPITAGEWHHLTYIFNVSDGNCYIYLNNTHIYTVAGALYNSSTISSVSGATEETIADNIYFKSVRDFQIYENLPTQNMSVSMDNFSITTIAAGENKYTAGAASIADWSVYGEDYTLPNRDPIALIDDVEYYDTASISDRLTASYDADDSDTDPYGRRVIFLRDYFGNLTIDCRATVSHNNVTVRSGALTIGEDLVYETADGITEYYKYSEVGTRTESEELSPSSSSFLSTDVVSALKAPDKAEISGVTYTTNSSGSNNLYSSHAIPNVRDGRTLQLVTVTDTDGVSRTVLKETGGTGHSDPYPQQQQLNPDDETQYLVYEVDTAYVGELSTTTLNQSYFNVYVGVDRIANDSIGTGTYTSVVGANVNSKIYIKDIFQNSDSVEFVHLTWIFNLHDGVMYTFMDNVLAGTTTFTLAEEEEGYTYRYIPNCMFFPEAYSGETFLYDNIYMGVHYITGAALEDIEDSVAHGTLTGDYAIDTEAYDYPQYATHYLAIVDGEYFYEGQEAELAAALTKYSTEPIQVIFLAEPQTAITVSGNVEIDTNGYDISDMITADTSSGYSSSASGNSISVVGPIPSNMTTEALTSSTKGNIYSAVKYPTVSGMSANQFSSVDLINSYFTDGGRTAYLVTNTENGQVYVYDTVYGTENTANSYFNLNMSGSTTYTSGIGQYVIIDLDIAFDTFNDDAVIEFNTRYPKGDGTTDTSPKSGTTFCIDTIVEDMGIELGKFAHLTFLCEVDTADVYVYVNGVQAAVKTDSLYKGTLGDTDFFSALRFAQGSSAKFAYDNVYMRLVADTSLSSDTFIGSAEDIYTGGYELPTHPDLATVDGEKIYSANDLEQALMGENRVEVVFHHIPSRAVEINCPANIETYGYAEDSRMYSIGLGYVKNDESSSGTYSVIDIELRYGTLTVTITVDGTAHKIVDGVSLIYGTDIEEYLKESGVICNALIISGSVYSGITWDGGLAPSGTIEAESASFSGAPSEILDNDYICIESDGTINTLESTDSGYSESLMAYFSNSGDRTIIFNEDWTVTNPVNINKTGTKNIYLNGNTITSSIDPTITGSRHGFVLNGTADVTFYGSGTLNFTVDKTSYALFYSAYDYTGHLVLNHLDIKLASELFQLRDGNFTVNGCSIDAFAAANYIPLISLGATTSDGYTDEPIHVTIKDSDVNYRYYMNADRYSGWQYTDAPLIKDNVITTDTSPEHRVYIEDSVITTQGSLVDTSDTQLTNLEVFINCSDILARSWYKSDVKRGTVILYEDVRTNIDDDMSIGVTDHLLKANISNSMYTLLYTSHDYATVTWSDGEVEYWASGSVPYYSEAKFDDISSVKNGVVAGENYTFTASASAAPFKFYASLSLSDKIGFNLFIPSGYEVSTVIIDGYCFTSSDGTATYSSTVGGDCTYYSVQFAPQEAARSFNITIILADGTVMSRSTSVGAYAKTLYNQTSADGVSAVYQAKNRALLSVALGYIENATAYAGYNVDMSEISSVLTNVKVTSATPTGTDHRATNSALAEYIKSAQVDLKNTCAIRFNALDGVDLSALTYLVDGEAVEVNVGDGYAEVLLRACDMNKDITIMDGDTVLGGYNIYTYYQTVSELEGTSYGYQYEYTTAMRLIKALWNYANTADQYLNIND